MSAGVGARRATSEDSLLEFVFSDLALKSSVSLDIPEPDGLRRSVITASESLIFSFNQCVNNSYISLRSREVRFGSS